MNTGVVCTVTSQICARVNRNTPAHTKNYKERKREKERDREGEREM